MAPVVRALRRRRDIASFVCVTAQHREMLDQVLDLFGILPDDDLNIMSPGQGLNPLLARMVAALDPVIEQVKPDRVLVHGDTTTGLAGALAAFHRGVPVGHVEAGLRTYNLAQPWPEEMNRRAIDLVSAELFAPTERSKENLAAERLEGRILVTGNTVIDALKHIEDMLEQHPDLARSLDATLPRAMEGRKLVLVTGHRRENHGDGLDNICQALATLASRDDVEIVFPVHLNPRVKGPVHARLGGLANVRLIGPQEYLPFVRLMQRADVILTDSGGIQEEAPFIHKPVLVLRDVTERPEAVEMGVARLVGADTPALVDAVRQLLTDKAAYAKMASGGSPYGDGYAAERIADAFGLVKGSPCAA